jgi:hypothetical protein
MDGRHPGHAFTLNPNTGPVHAVLNPPKVTNASTHTAGFFVCLNDRQFRQSNPKTEIEK